KSLYGVGIVLAVVSLVLDVLYYTRLYRQFGSDPWPSAAVAIKVYFAFCLFVGVVLLWRTWRVTGSERSKRQIALLAVGTAVALLPLIVLILIPQILFAHYLIPSWIPLLMLAFLPAGYLYATYRHDLMKLDGMVSRSVVVCFLGLALVLLYLGLEWGIRSLAPGARSRPVILGDVIPVLALLFAFQPLKRRIERLVDRVFYGGWYNYESLILEMSQALNEAADLETIVTLLTQRTARTMRVKRIALLLPDGEGAFCVRASRGFEPPITTCLSQGLVAFLRERGKPVEHGPLCNWPQSGSELGQEIAAHTQAGVQMWVPLVHQGELEAILVLGGKVADEFYTQNDQAILFTLAQQAAIALARTRLVDELKGRLEEVQALSEQLLTLQERNQQRMALELHDQVVQDVLYVQRQVDSALKKAPSRELEGARDELLRIAGYLDTLIFDLRPPELEQGELDQILHKCAANFELRRELPVAFRANGGSDSAALPEEIKLAVYRIFQESLNNARKHAGASQVEASLDVQHDRVRLEVYDDGAGFGVPTHLGRLIGANRFGLLGMRTRAEEVGGRLRVTSQPGQGTHVLLEVPLPA
ncbi:MAG: sensor histidine kinase, partial [Armatimonadetes bacterium]|nr:sensor histidine kinase [Armatimonadota bacterium]